LWLYLIEGKSGKGTTEKMIATLREKTRHEKESLTKTLVDYKQQLEKAKEIEKREHKTQQSRDVPIS
jgi:hypothetical protein